MISDSRCHRNSRDQTWLHTHSAPAWTLLSLHSYSTSLHLHLLFPPLPPLLAESGCRLSCVATATAASSSTCCSPLPFILPLFTPLLSLPLCPPPLPPSVPLKAPSLPLSTSEETPSSGGKTLAVSPRSTLLCLYSSFGSIAECAALFWTSSSSSFCCQHSNSCKIFKSGRNWSCC